MANSKRLRGFKWNENSSRLEVWIDGTLAAYYDDVSSDLTIVNNGFTITAGGITVTLGGATVTGGLTVTGASTFADAVTFTSQIVHSSPNSSTITSDTALDTNDAGKLIICATDNVTITLPATAAGLTYTIVNTAADGAALITVDTNISDRIIGPNTTGSDGKNLSNTKLTHVQGDYIKLMGDSAEGWRVMELAGTWAAETG